MSLLFCPCCGYKTLVRVVATVDAEGRRQLRPLSQKQFSKRGLKVNGDWSIWVGQCTVCVCLGGGGVGELWTFVDVVPQYVQHVHRYPNNTTDHLSVNLYKHSYASVQTESC